MHNALNQELADYRLQVRRGREGQSLEPVVDELDRGFLVAARVDAQHTQSSAVADRSKLVVRGAPSKAARPHSLVAKRI